MCRHTSSDTFQNESPCGRTDSSTGPTLCCERLILLLEGFVLLRLAACRLERFFVVVVSTTPMERVDG